VFWKKSEGEKSVERLGKFLKEHTEYADLLFQAGIGSAHEDTVHVELEDNLPENWKEGFRKYLMEIRDCIAEHFEFDMSNYYMLMFELERVKRKFRIDFDEQY
jgi:hypothetical protein